MYMIYQLENAPIKDTELISESSFFGTSFMNTVAEYVTQDIDTDAETENLISIIEKYGGKTCRDEMCFWFPDGFQRLYFKERFRQFKQIIKDLSCIDLGLFCHSNIVTGKINQASACHNRRDEDYVYSNGEIMTFDEFVRELSPDDEYYLGSIVAYK